ncbi:carboxypeptidase regulatory-like domain-containing protein [Cupriavidus sp. BIC8F]|uniref:carboxypeptidase regulatory-like domain-containing protein n=1 Tax=Cupriavidus sp. BIC8F TaxID=3079014 RepID=UPI00291697C4|nr:carboxypeptidase regulatory-like domain-containing protein [Cupriavidus sp. BIC8F]
MKRKALVGHAATVAACLATMAPLVGAQPNLPPVRAQGTVRYVTGGIGLDEADAIKQAAAQYPLELQFYRKAVPRDEYLSDVKVLIKDEAGKEFLATTSEGPFLLAKLPEGRYRVSAERHGIAKQRVVQIRASQHQRLIFEWQE